MLPERVIGVVSRSLEITTPGGRFHSSKKRISRVVYVVDDRVNIIVSSEGNQGVCKLVEKHGSDLGMGASDQTLDAIDRNVCSRRIGVLSNEKGQQRDRMPGDGEAR